MKAALRFRLAWLWLWGVAAAILLTVSLAAGQERVGLAWLGQFLFAFGVSLITPKKGFKSILVAILIFFLASALAEPVLSARVWPNPDARDMMTTLTSLNRASITRTSTRSWSAPPESEELKLSFDARVVSGETGWDWFRSVRRFELTPLEEGEQFTRVKTPLEGDPYLMRTFDLGAPAANRTFKVELELRAPAPVPIAAEGCRGIWLQTWGEGGSSTCRELALGSEWRNVELLWTVPSSSTSSVIRIVLNDFNGLSYDVKNVKLFERRESKWSRLAPLIQEGAAVTLSYPEASSVSDRQYGFMPDETWQTFTFDAASYGSAVSGTPNIIRTSVGVGSAQTNLTTLELRNTRLRALDGRSAKPQPNATFARSQLWFSHPNLAAHTVLSISLAALSASLSPGAAALIAGLAAPLIFATGSRAALLALLFGSGWFLWLFLRRRSVRLLSVGAVILLLGLGGFILFQGTPLIRGSAARPQIWRAALRDFWEHPWQGMSFSHYWQANYAQFSSEQIVHAHNLWLEFAASYGLPGLLAILWLSCGLLYLAWSWGRWRGLALVVPTFLMNLFDYTLFYSGVLIPLILGINALRTSSSHRLNAENPVP